MNTPAAELLMDQFLRWVADRPRRYEEAMEAWRSSCPRLSVWEDALDQGLIRLEPVEGPGGGRGLAVRLAAAGLARLAAGERAGPVAAAAV